MTENTELYNKEPTVNGIKTKRNSIQEAIQ
jgi:hypothetical protein